MKNLESIIGKYLLNEGEILGDKTKDESITTTSAGVPGEGPIADVQNGISADPAMRKEREENEKCRKKRLFDLDLEEIFNAIKEYDKKSHIVGESQKISVDDIFSALGGENSIKTKKTYKKALEYIENSLESLTDILQISEKDIPWNKIKERLKKIFK